MFLEYLVLNPIASFFMHDIKCKLVMAELISY